MCHETCKNVLFMSKKSLIKLTVDALHLISSDIRSLTLRFTVEMSRNCQSELSKQCFFRVCARGTRLSPAEVVPGLMRALLGCHGNACGLWGCFLPPMQKRGVKNVWICLSVSGILAPEQFNRFRF